MAFYAKFEERGGSCGVSKLFDKGGAADGRIAAWKRAVVAPEPDVSVDIETFGDEKHVLGSIVRTAVQIESCVGKIQSALEFEPPVAAIVAVELFAVR